MKKERKEAIAREEGESRRGGKSRKRVERIPARQ